MLCTWLLKMASGSIPLAEGIRKCVRGGSDDENSDESEGDISEWSEESEEDLDYEEREASGSSEHNSDASEVKNDPARSLQCSVKFVKFHFVSTSRSLVGICGTPEWNTD